MYKTMTGLSPFTSTFCHYLNQSLGQRRQSLSFDQWIIFPTFSRLFVGGVGGDDARLMLKSLQKYDPSDCWPTLYDEYVTWMKGEVLQ